LYPAYYLITVLYAPPGTKSKASYADGSSAGTSTSAANMFGAGIKVGITGNVIAGADYQFTAQNTQSFQVTKTAKTELDISATADRIDHGQDLFYLWINPEIDYSQQQSPGEPVNISFGTTGNVPMTVVPFNLNELTGKETIPAYKLQQIPNMTPNDFAQIASADPWLSPGYQPDRSRYIYIRTLQLDGPDNAGDAIPGQATSVDDSQVNCTTNATSQEIGADFGFSAGADFFGQGEHATVVASVSYKNTSSAGNCNGATQTATVGLATGTVGFHDVIDVFEDSIYHSFAYVSETSGAGLQALSADVSGEVLNAQGRPMPNQPIVVKFANGHTESLFSNAQGRYRIFKIPTGPLTITCGESVTRVTLTPGQRIVKNLRLSSIEPTLRVP
jgi:hypothetical protein